MKRIFSLILIIAIASCNPDNPEAIKNKLIKLKEKRMVINNEIAMLERELKQDSTKTKPENTIPVKVKTLDFEEFNHFILVSGNVEAEKHALVSPEVNGQIEKIYVSEGEQVEKGKLLVSLNTRVIESSIEEIKTGLELARKVFEKQKKLWEQNIGSEMQYLDAKNAKELAENRLKTLKTQVEMARIRAPFTGFIERISGKEGEMASPGKPILEMVNLSNMKIYADVSEKYLTMVKEGDMATVHFASLPDVEKETPVYRTGNVINRNSRTFTIELKIDNPDNQLKPNLMATVMLNDFSKDSTLVVPSDIIKKDMQGEYIYLAVNTGESIIAQKIYIDTGLSYKDKTMITGGVKNGDKVIIAGYTEVSDGVKINVKKTD
ncbi:MAG: efflux RND transporter periplasmic adaptor subunit [Bacteroidetes bacterium]|nr:efflux RND transporter periplasmic adaptor subunit [Bacteroidota bacterium]